MVALAAGNPPLTHFLTDLHVPRCAPSEVLEGQIKSLKCKAFAFDVLEKISYVALIAITATVLAVHFSAVTLTGVLPMVMAFMILSTLAIGAGLSKLHMKAKEFSSRAEVEGRVLAELKKIEHWKTPEITQFLIGHRPRIVPQHIPLESLRQLNGHEPLRALLPLVARFNMLKAESQAVENWKPNYRQELEETLQKREADVGQPIPSEEKQNLRYEAEKIHFVQHERYGIPPAIKAAVILQLIQDPTERVIDFDPLGLEIAGVGRCAAKDFDKRVFGRVDAFRNDDYFVFHPALKRDPIQLGAIERDMDPAALRALLFPNAIRA